MGGAHVSKVTGDYRYLVTFVGGGRKFDQEVFSVQDVVHYYMSRVVRKPAFCICGNKDADQLRGNREAAQRLCFRYTDSTIPLVPKSVISSL